MISQSERAIASWSPGDVVADALCDCTLYVTSRAEEFDVGCTVSALAGCAIDVSAGHASTIIAGERRVA